MSNHCRNYTVMEVKQLMLASEGRALAWVVMPSRSTAPIGLM